MTTAGFCEERKRRVPSGAANYAWMKRFSEIQKIYPWAESVIVCVTWQEKYKYPEPLRGKYAKAYMLSSHTVPVSREHREKLGLEKWFAEHEIRFDGGCMSAPGYMFPMRHAAVMMRMGIFRKNNFFYGEKGSHYELEGYVIDKRCEYKHRCDIKPCPENCGLCQNACKTHSLCALYTMNPAICTSYLTAFAKGSLPDGIEEEQLGTWMCGCDDCQDACPFNRHDWSSGESFYGLDEITELFQPENILKAQDDVLRERVVPKTDSHILESELQTLRISAERVL